MKEILNAAVYCRFGNIPREDCVWLYARTATGEPDLLDLQIQVLTEQAKKKGLTVVGTSQDIASGRSLDRPGLQKMLKAVREDKIGAVMVHDLSRLGRDWDVLTHIFQELEQHQVSLLGSGDHFTRNLTQSESIQAMQRFLKPKRHEQER